MTFSTELIDFGFCHFNWVSYYGGIYAKSLIQINFLIILKSSVDGTMPKEWTRNTGGWLDYRARDFIFIFICTKLALTSDCKIFLSPLIEDNS